MVSGKKSETGQKSKKCALGFGFFTHYPDYSVGNMNVISSNIFLKFKNQSICYDEDASKGDISA